MGYNYGMWKKGILIDGHEFADVIDHRKEFLIQMLSRLKSIQWLEVDDMQLHQDRSARPQQRLCGSRTTSPYFTRTTTAVKGGAQKITLISIRRGTMEGQSWFRISSALVMADYSQLDGVPISVIIKPEKNQDGYWQETDILKRLEEKAIPVFN